MIEPLSRCRQLKRSRVDVVDDEGVTISSGTWMTLKCKVSMVER